MRRGRKIGSSGIDLPGDQHIREIEEEGYRYLGILQLDKILNTKMKIQYNSRVCGEGKEAMQIQTKWRKYDQ